MMTKKFLAALAAVLLVAGQAFAAATLTTTVSNPGKNYTKYNLAWVSHTDGVVALTFDVRAGELVQVRFVPDGGDTQPTNLYDVTITNSQSFDVLAQTSGANLSNATATQVVATTPLFIEAGTLTLNVAAAGSGKGGTVVLFVK